jgi:hypothetical protein
VEKMSWADHVRYEAVLQRVKEERNIPQTTKRRKANWIRHILHRNCPPNNTLERNIEGRKEVTGRRGIRRKQLLHDPKEKREYHKLKEKH